MGGESPDPVRFAPVSTRRSTSSPGWSPRSQSEDYLLRLMSGFVPPFLKRHPKRALRDSIGHSWQDGAVCASTGIGADRLEASGLTTWRRLICACSGHGPRVGSEEARDRAPRPPNGAYGARRGGSAWLRNHQCSDAAEGPAGVEDEVEPYTVEEVQTAGGGWRGPQQCPVGVGSSPRFASGEVLGLQCPTWTWPGSWW